MGKGFVSLESNLVRLFSPAADVWPRLAGALLDCAAPLSSWSPRVLDRAPFRTMADAAMQSSIDADDNSAAFQRVLIHPVPPLST